MEWIGITICVLLESSSLVQGTQETDAACTEQSSQHFSIRQHGAVRWEREVWQARKHTRFSIPRVLSFVLRISFNLLDTCFTHLLLPHTTMGLPSVMPPSRTLWHVLAVLEGITNKHGVTCSICTI